MSLVFFKIVLIKRKKCSWHTGWNYRLVIDGVILYFSFIEY